MLQVLSCEKVGFKKSKGKCIASGAKNKRYGFVDCVFTLTLKLFVLSAMRKVRLFTGKEKMLQRLTALNIGYTIFGAINVTKFVCTKLSLKKSYLSKKKHDFVLN